MHITLHACCSTMRYDTKLIVSYLKACVIPKGMCHSRKFRRCSDGLSCSCASLRLVDLQARVSEMSAAHASALSALNDRLDSASKSIAHLKQQMESGQGELAEMEARVRALHHDLQVGDNTPTSARAGVTFVSGQLRACIVADMYCFF